MAFSDRRVQHLTINAGTSDEQTYRVLQWQREKPEKADFSVGLPFVQKGSLPGELIIGLDDFSQGWGQLRQREPGRYLYGENVSCIVPGQVTLAPLVTFADRNLSYGAAAVQFFEFPGGSTLYACIGRFITPITPSTVAFGTDIDLGAGKAASQVALIDGYAVVANYTVSGGAANNLVKVASNEATSNGNTALDAVCAASDSSGAILYAAVRSGTITSIQKFASGADVTADANWGGDTAFGETGEIYRWLVAYGYEVYGACPIAFTGFDQALNTPNILPWLKYYRTSTNGIGTIHWDDALLIPTIRGLHGYNGSVGDIGPLQETGLRRDENSRFFGTPTGGIAADSDLVYLITDNGTDTYVWAGRKRDDNAGLIWHSWLYLSAKTGFKAATVTGITSPPRMFLARNATTGTYAYLDLPRGTSNPLQDPQPFAASGILYTCGLDGGQPGTPGVFEGAAFWTESISADETIAVSYRMGLSGSWTSLGTIDNTTVTNGVATFWLSTPAAGEVVQFKLAFARGSTNTNTPVLRGMKVWMIKQAQRRQVIRATLLCQDYETTRQGGIRAESAKTLKDALVALEEGTTVKTLYTPIDDGTGSVESLTTLLLGDVKFRAQKTPDFEYPVLVADVTFVEVAA